MATLGQAFGRTSAIGDLLQKKTPASAALAKTGAPTSTAGTATANQTTSPAATTSGSTMPTVTASTVDLTGANASYDAQRQQFADANNKATAYANWQNQMRGAAANNSAARAGLAAGGASYLAGAGQAQKTSAANLNNVYATNATNMGNSYGAQAGTQANAAATNASLGQQAATFNTGNQLQLDQQTAATQATQSANAATADLGNIQSQLANYNIHVETGKGATGALAKNLVTELQKATPNTPEYAAAKAKLDKYLGALAEAKGRWQALGKGQQAYGGSFQTYLKAQEQSGYFNI